MCVSINNPVNKHFTVQVRDQNPSRSAPLCFFYPITNLIKISLACHKVAIYHKQNTVPGRVDIRQAARHKIEAVAEEEDKKIGHVVQTPFRGERTVSLALYFPRNSLVESSILLMTTTIVFKNVKHELYSKQRLSACS